MNRAHGKRRRPEGSTEHAVRSAGRRYSVGRFQPLPKAARGTRRGIVLLLVLVVIAMLSLGAYTYCQLMQAEREAVEVTGRRAQARVLAESGLEFARFFLGQEKQVQLDAGGCYDNPTRFRGALVLDDNEARGRGRFTLVAPSTEFGLPGGVRFGLEDMSNRLNLNALPLAERSVPGSGKEILMGLPGMTDEIADSILDWIDQDEEPREFGAESEYYGALDPPYAPRNGPLATIEELLLVRGVTPSLLFGVDANRNGIADRNEADPQSIEGVDNADGSMDRGWAAYLTLWSFEKNVRPDGTPKIDLNQSDMKKLNEELTAALGAEMAKFIVGLRQYGPSSSTREPDPTATFELNLDTRAKYKLTSVLDLIGAKFDVQVQSESRSGKPTTTTKTIPSPFVNVPGLMNAYLPLLMENVTVNPSPVIPGRININQAPRIILAGIPGMNDDIVDQILSRRQENPVGADPNRQYETWILAEGIVTLEEMKILMPFVCAGGDVFRVESVGYYDEGGLAARIEAVLDATKSPARVLFWRDISHLGRGYSLEMLGTEAM